MSETIGQDDSKAREELEFWKKEVVRIQANWLATWQAFQVQYNELNAQVKLLCQIVEAKPVEQPTLQWGE